LYPKVPFAMLGCIPMLLLQCWVSQPNIAFATLGYYIFRISDLQVRFSGVINKVQKVIKGFIKQQGHL
jgi:hypothetical protein